jgi:hypothetical protein
MQKFSSGGKKVSNKFNLPLLSGWVYGKVTALFFSLPQSTAGAQWRLLINKNVKCFDFYGLALRADICLRERLYTSAKNFRVSHKRLQFQYCATFEKNR